MESWDLSKEGQRDLKSTMMSHEWRSLGAYHSAPPFPTRKAPSPSSSRWQGKKEPCWGHVALDPIPGPRTFTIDNNMPFLSCGLSLYAIGQYKTKPRKWDLAGHLMDLSRNTCSDHCVGLQTGQTAFSVWRAALGFQPAGGLGPALSASVCRGNSTTYFRWEGADPLPLWPLSWTESCCYQGLFK